MKIFSDENSSTLSKHPPRWPSFRERFKDFKLSEILRQVVREFRILPPKKERRSLEEGVAAQQRKRLLWRFSIRKWIRLKWNKIRGELFDFIFHEHGLLSWSLFRRKVDNNLSSSRFGTYGRRKIASMRGEFLGIEVRLRVRKRAKWRGECEWESLARLWRCASIRISNTSISTYFHDKRIFLFRESFGEIVGYWTEE